MKKKADAVTVDQATGRLREAKDAHKRLRLLAKAAKRDVKEARKALKRARKLAEPIASSKLKKKVAKKRAAKGKPKTRAKAVAESAQNPAPGPRALHGASRAQATPRRSPARVRSVPDLPVPAVTTDESEASTA